MPEALYIPGAPSLGRPLKDNLSDPRCSAQHRPLPHRAPPGRYRRPRSPDQLTELPAGLPRAEGEPDAPPPAERSPPEVALPSVGERSAPATPPSAAAHGFRSSRRRLVLDGSSAVPLPGDVADVDGDVQHIDADDHRTWSTLKTTSVARAASRRSSTRVGMVRPARHGAVPGEGAAAAGRPGRRRPPVPCRCHGCAGRRQVDRATRRSRGAGGRHRR